MKPTIVLIERLHHHVKLNLLRKLQSTILQSDESSEATIFPSELLKEFISIVRIGSFKIGLYESDSTRANGHQLDFFANKSCDLVLCHVTAADKLLTKLSDLEAGKRINFIHFKRIWLDAISIDSLEDCEVENLFELVGMKLAFKQASNKHEPAIH